VSGSIDIAIKFANFVVPILTLVVIAWYTYETKKIRKAAQDQVTASQELLRAANDQAEGVAKPCITLWSDLRNPTDTLLNMHQAVGGTIVRDNRGDYVIVNIGNGLALNVEYVFNVVHESGPIKEIARSYLQSVAPNQMITLALPINAHVGDHHFVFRFQSLGGRWYESAVRVKSKVLTDLAFRPMPPRTQAAGQI